jgi:predicted GTPase
MIFKEVQDAAYFLWLNRGRPVDQDVEIWKEAERTLFNSRGEESYRMKGDLTVEIVHNAHINELLSVSNEFSFIKDTAIVEDEGIRWNMNGETAFCVQVMFIGKTGYGKSTTLNRICGHKYFETNDIESCTKKLFSCEYKISKTKQYYFSLCDLPGIGESIRADKEYINWYGDMLKKSACVVYILRADQRDFAVDEEIINKIITNSDRITAKLVICLNYADKIEPVSRILPFVPNTLQLKNIERKKDTISKIFNIENERIICYSASEGYNLNNLKEAVANAVKSGIENRI